MLMGNFPFITALCSHSIWTPFARLSFSLYLMHICVINTYMFNEQVASYWNNWNVYRDIMVCLVIAFALSAIASFMAESPFMNLERILFRR
jgi:peptidoglycan/LPS O-acetylase OafA/YrhL